MSVGYVYVMSNESMPGIAKIGMTNRKPDERARELSNHTGVPLPFVVEGYRLVRNAVETERVLHDWFGPKRVSGKREFFLVSPQSAVEMIHAAECLGDLDETMTLKTWLFPWGKPVYISQHEFLLLKG